MTITVLRWGQVGVNSSPTTNAIIGHFFKDVLQEEHAREYAEKWFGLTDHLEKPADLAGTCPDPEESWQREKEEWKWS